ncbi:hypothetical protein F1559_001039 [Cyanidiococcus yangmingshanensis]|uniref:Metallo-beta-lactamase domain-containing protein n=1 Tax=Cyanidiococcus yangmingshanensis TaxID=2690220 RepID=A0A7J7IES1_9RHOD|nr:hypothetical protein F1559_001039 [Cyanidiococcus yangmingshanensis]
MQRLQQPGLGTLPLSYSFAINIWRRIGLHLLMVPDVRVLPALLARITTVYLDPVFSDRASPVSFLGPKRLVKAAPLEECPLPELVCISHNHYDHCDVGTIRALVARARSQNRSITWLVPLGLGPLLRDQNRIWGGWIPSSHPVHELDWFEQRTIGTLEVALVPAQHATGRSPWDRDRTLWGGWVLRHMDTNVRCYFAGDTAYRVIDESNEGYPYPTEAERQQLAEQYPKRKPCPAFRTIGDKWGPFDLAMIPIGAYSPRWFMSRFHVDPVDFCCDSSRRSGALERGYAPFHVRAHRRGPGGSRAATFGCLRHGWTVGERLCRMETWRNASRGPQAR